MTVAILLATYNGADFLAEQLQSYCAQSCRDWALLASDNGSSDATRDILDRFCRENPGRIRLLSGPRQGAAANFLSLLRQAPDFEHAAFSDQDDFWLEGKLARALDMLGRVPAQVPALYASRVTICDARLRPLSLSPRLRRPAGFRNALVENVLHGHSIVANRPALALLRRAASRTSQVVMHDWWAYQLVSGAGGHIIFDGESHVLYRQHGDNEIGGRRGWGKALLRLTFGRQAEWMDRNLTTLCASADLLGTEHCALVADLVAARRLGRLAFTHACLRGGLYRQRLGRSGPVLAALAGRL